MKKIKLLKSSLMLAFCIALGSTMLNAQSAAKKPGIKNDPAQIKIARQAAEEKKQDGLKEKCQANGVAYHANSASKQSAARPCVNNTSTGPRPVKKSTFDHLSTNGQALIKNHPEKYTIEE